MSHQIPKIITSKHAVSPSFHLPAASNTNASSKYPNPSHNAPQTSSPNPTSTTKIQAVPTVYGEYPIGDYPLGLVPTCISQGVDRDLSVPLGLDSKESHAVRKLQEAENTLDYFLKKAEFKFITTSQHYDRRSTTTKKILRFTISNTHEGQFGQHQGAQPSWTIRLSGRLLDESGKILSGAGTRKMSSFLKFINVHLDKAEFPNQWSMSWSKEKAGEEVDAFTFSRKSTRESIANIYLVLNKEGTYNEHFSPSAPLRSLLGLNLPSYPRDEIFVRLWGYIRDHNLQSLERKCTVRCDDALSEIFDVSSFHYSELQELILPHLLPPEPIFIPYHILFCNDPSESEVVYDIPVDVESPQMANSTVNPSVNLNSRYHQVMSVNRQITDLIEQINEKKRKRDFYMDFANDPVEFMNDWIISQSRDFSTLCYPSTSDQTFESQTEFFTQPLVRHAVHRYVEGSADRMPQS